MPSSAFSHTAEKEECPLKAGDNGNDTPLFVRRLTTPNVTSFHVLYYGLLLAETQKEIEVGPIPFDSSRGILSNLNLY